MTGNTPVKSLLIIEYLQSQVKESIPSDEILKVHQFYYNTVLLSKMENDYATWSRVTNKCNQNFMKIYLLITKIEQLEIRKFTLLIIPYKHPVSNRKSWNFIF